MDAPVEATNAHRGTEDLEIFQPEAFEDGRLQEAVHRIGRRIHAKGTSLLWLAFSTSLTGSAARNTAAWSGFKRSAYPTIEADARSYAAAEAASSPVA